MMKAMMHSKIILVSKNASFSNSIKTWDLGSSIEFIPYVLARTSMLRPS